MDYYVIPRFKNIHTNGVQQFFYYFRVHVKNITSYVPELYI